MNRLLFSAIFGISYTALIFLFFNNLKRIKRSFNKIWVKIFGVAKPECEKHWTTLYYGDRGSCKTLHQGKETIHIIKYAFISERMKQEGMFIQFTETRTIHSRRPVIDIWNNNINWKLVYDNHGVKVYERLDYTELLK